MKALSFFNYSMVKQSLIIAGLFFSLSANAAITYYVASDGDDNNNGQSQQTPWQTISKVNSMMSTFVGGDQILFKSGDRFFGTVLPSKSGTSGNLITFGSYGNGNLPIITGKKEITDWTLYSGSIYAADFSDSLSNLFVNDKLMTIARYPNNGFLRIDAGNGNTGFSDAQLTQGSGYWTGATCRIRTINWQYETPVVSGFSNGTITFAGATQYPPGAGYGYYLDNKLSELDAEGEWYHDIPNGKVYLFAPGGVNPNTLTVEGIVQNHGFAFTSSRYFIKVQDLNITGYKSQGIEANGANHDIVIKGCTISYTGKFGIRLSGSRGLIDGNTLTDNFNTAISGVIKDAVISNNILKRTGLIPGYGNNGSGYRGIVVYTGLNTIIEFNVIDSTGYSGMSTSSNMIIRNNIVNNSCLTLNDGGGIELNGADGLQVLNNIVTSTIGNAESSVSPVRYGNGIYFGSSYTKNILIQGNTVANNSTAGITVDNKSTSENNQFLDNVVYNNAYTQILFSDYSSTSFTPSYSNTVKGNIFYGLSLSQSCMEHIMFRSPNFSDFGSFDSNWYCNPYSEIVVKRSMVYGTYTSRYLRLKRWQSEFNEDLTSRYSQFTFDQYKVTDTLSSNLITNSRFASNINPWTTTPAPGSAISYATNQLLDTGCMKATWNGAGSYEGMTSGNYVNIVKGNYYFVSLSCAGNYSGDLNTFGRPVVGGNPFIYPRRFLGFETYRREHSFVFRADTSDASMRVAICLWLPDTSVYVDNVYMYRVNVERIDSTEINKLFTNNTNTTQVISLDGITYRDPDSTIVTGSITLQPYSSRILIKDYSSPPSANLQLTALTQGLYNPSANTMIRDTFKVYLRDAAYPFTVVDSAISYVSSSGLGSYDFTNAVNGTNYYLSVSHRNSIETWSGSIVSFTNNEAVYDFTTAASKAFGNNLIKVDSSPLRFAIYGGDVNRDKIINALDISLIDNDAFNFATGYIVTDLTGDGNVDVSDILIVEKNCNNFVGVISP